MNKKVFMILFLAVMLGMVSLAWASWSDNFTGNTSQQTWVNVDLGNSSTFNFTNDRYQLHTESETGGAVASFVNQSGSDYIMQARVQSISAEDDYLTYLMVRANPSTVSGYVCGTSSDGNHLWIGKITNGVYSNLPASANPTFDASDHQVRFAVFGNTLKAKVWSTGSTEPSDWLISCTDNSYTSGVGGLMLATYPTFDWDVVQSAFDDVSLTTISQEVVWVDGTWNGSASGKEVAAGKIFGYNAFATIQNGITAVVPNGTVNVAAGDYPQTATLTVGKSLSLIGSGPTSAPTTVITSSASRIFTLSVTGLSFTFQNLIFEGINTNNGIYAGSSVDINTLTVKDVIARNCQVAIYLAERYPNTTTVNTLSFDNVTVTNNKYIGVYIGKTILAGTVENSTFTDNGYSDELPNSWQKTGLQFVNFDVATVPCVTVTNCDFARNGDGASNIERTGLILYTAYNSHTNNALLTVSGCAFTDHDQYAVRVKNGYNWDNTAIVNGTFTNNWLDIWFNNVDGTTSSTTNVRRTEDGVRTVGSGPTYSYSTIQAAINAAYSGDVIQVAAGIYEEQLHITTNNLSILGAGKSYTTVLAPNVLASSFLTGTNNNRPVVFADGVDTFTLKDITIDGAGKGNANYRFIGLGFWNAGGIVENVDVLRIMDTPFSGSQHGVGVYAYSNTTGIDYNIACSNMTVDDYQKNGMALMGADLTIALDNITIIGAGATTVTAQNGIQIGYGTGGTIINSNISGNIYAGSGWSSAGILAYQGAPLAITNTIVANNYVGIDMNDSGGSITGCLVTNTDPAAWDAIYMRNYSAKGTGNVNQGVQKVLNSSAPISEAYTYNSNRASCSLVLNDVEIIGSNKADSWGLYVGAGAGTQNMSMTNCEVTGWAMGVVTYDNGGTVTSSSNGNFIYNNLDYGFYSETANLQDATKNYWGHLYGPSHENNPFNELTTGNAVSDNVTFMPWYATPTTTPDTEFATFKNWDGTRGTYNVFTSDELANALAVATNGDEIVLGSGTFVGNFTIAADITITAATGTVPVIQGVNGGAALTITADGVSITGVTIQADEDDDAVVVTAAVADGATVSVVNGSIIVSGAGIGVVNNSVNNGSAYVLATGNWWGGVDPAILISGTVDYGDALDIEPLIIRVTADEVLIKDVEELLYTVSVSQVTNLNSYKVQLKFRKADFNAPVFEDDFVIGALFVNDFFDYELIADTNYYIYEVTGSNLGLGITGENVVLFTVNLTSKLNASNLSGSLVTIVYGTVVLYGTGNPPDIITCTGTSGKLVVIDSDEPLLAAIPQTSGETLPIDAAKSAADEYANVVDTFLTLSFSDDYNLDFLRYKVQLQSADVPTTVADFNPYGLNPADIATGISGTLWNNEEENWQIPDALLNAGLDDLPTGSYSIFFYAQDDAGNYNIFSWDFLIDKTATEPITWVKCLTTPDSNNKIDLEWTNNGTVANNHIWVLNYDHLSLEAGAYPEFNPAGFIVPDVPAINQYGGSVENGWQKTIIAANTTYLYEPAGRGYYYFAIFSEDAAGNISTAPVYKESISYWPGDIDADGDVEATGDITALSTVWGLTSASVGWDANLDVGPSVDRTRRGLRTPDDRINIEDLMMFSMNYGNTDYDPYPRGDDELTPIRIELLTEIVENNLVVQVMLSENTGIVKGLNIPVQYGTGLSLQSVELGGIWPEDSVVLYTNNQNVAEVSMTTLGANSLVLENGNVATLTFVIEGTVLDTELKHMIARNIDNAEIEIINNPDPEPTGNEDLVIVIPATNFLGNNYPNPFNPSTTFQFGLKQAQNVKITIYNVRGQVVKTLVNGMTPAGIHNIVWNGKDNNNRAIASGMYFYKMETNDYSKVKKTILLK
jgi:hypothetical protein